MTHEDCLRCGTQRGQGVPHECNIDLPSSHGYDDQSEATIEVSKPLIALLLNEAKNVCYTSREISIWLKQLPKGTPGLPQHNARWLERAVDSLESVINNLEEPCQST